MCLRSQIAAYTFALLVCLSDLAAAEPPEQRPSQTAAASSETQAVLLSRKMGSGLEFRVCRQAPLTQATEGQSVHSKLWLEARRGTDTVVRFWELSGMTLGSDDVGLGFADEKRFALVCSLKGYWVYVREFEVPDDLKTVQPVCPLATPEAIEALNRGKHRDFFKPDRVIGTQWVGRRPFADGKPEVGSVEWLAEKGAWRVNLFLHGRTRVSFVRPANADQWTWQRRPE